MELHLIWVMPLLMQLLLLLRQAGSVLADIPTQVSSALNAERLSPKLGIALAVTRVIRVNSAPNVERLSPSLGIALAVIREIPVSSVPSVDNLRQKLGIANAVTRVIQASSALIAARVVPNNLGGYYNEKE